MKIRSRLYRRNRFEVYWLRPGISHWNDRRALRRVKRTLELAMFESNDHNDNGIFSLNKIPQRARLLALKSIVVFPHVLTGLRVESSAELATIGSVLRGSKLLAVGTYRERPGPEHPPSKTRDAEEPFRVEKIGCLCRILAHHFCRSTGGMNILLVGLCRVRFAKELRRIRENAREPQRWMQIVPFRDEYPPENSSRWNDRKKRLQRILGDFLHNKDKEQTDSIRTLLRNVDSFGCISDILASLFEFSPRNKLALLREHSVERRLAILTRLIREAQSDELYDELQHRFGFRFQSPN